MFPENTNQQTHSTNWISKHFKVHKGNIIDEIECFMWACVPLRLFYTEGTAA